MKRFPSVWKGLSFLGQLRRVRWILRLPGFAIGTQICWLGNQRHGVFGIAWISYNQSDAVGIAYVVWSWYWWNVRVIHEEEGVRDDTPLWYPLPQVKWISNSASKFYLCLSFRKLPSSLQSESGRLASSNCARSPSSLWHTTEDDVAVFLQLVLELFLQMLMRLHDSASASPESLLFVTEIACFPPVFCFTRFIISVTSSIDISWMRFHV